MGDVMRSAAQLAESDYEEVQMEGRIARLESDVSHIQKDVAEIKVNLKSLDGKIDGHRDRIDSRMDGLRDRMDDMRNKMEVGFTDIRQSIAQLAVAMEKAYGKSKVETIATRVWALSTLGGVLLLMARVFKWI
jgi:predicted nuclease with TOPRIM domain